MGRASDRVPGWTKPERFVEAHGGLVPRAETEHIETPSSGRHDLRDQLPANTKPPERG